MKLELGCGERPTPGYMHNDINPFEGVEFPGPAWEINLPDGSLDEVIALGVIEHLTYGQVADTFRNVARMLRFGSLFLFDVPDLPVWCRYVVDHHDGKPIPFDIAHVHATLYGWQRWPGDEHKSGWDAATVGSAVTDAGFRGIDHDLAPFEERGLQRRRMGRPTDAHIYCVAVR